MRLKTPSTIVLSILILNYVLIGLAFLIAFKSIAALLLFLFIASVFYSIMWGIDNKNKVFLYIGLILLFVLMLDGISIVISAVFFDKTSDLFSVIRVFLLGLLSIIPFVHIIQILRSGKNVSEK